ncbi:SulP family inorganic anion transporter [Geovibrio ferrireducens]|uniref:SulP family inorganic anion transporter n=1 Tax=Geovibrio ferrireducens TaxID=46201 RepID=UPI00224537F9|nr:SulP family inorganic anion transporter [Geovibrio ferrireducens]
MRKRDYTKRLAGDLYGGITAGVIALPLALAFGVASGAGAQAGLYGAIILGLTAAVFGGTPVQISGPTGPMTVVTASAVALYHGDMTFVITIIFLGGLFQVLLGFCRIGGLIRYIPYPVISGFMTGIGIIIILLQIHPLTGAGSVRSPIMAISEAGRIFTDFSPNDLALGLITLAIVFLTPKKVTRVLPSPLIALIGVTAFAGFMGFNTAVIGHIPSGLPSFHLPVFSISQLTFIVTTAMSLAVLGSIDSLLTSLVSDSLTRTKHNPNKELFGQGLGNMLSSLAGGIPGAGATMRTVINVKSGGTTRLSGIVHALLLLGFVLGFGEQAERVPLSVLAGILIKVGFDIVDYRFLKIIRKAPRHDIAVMSIVLVLTVFVDLIVAVGVGLVAASVLLTYRISTQTQTQVDDVDLETADSAPCGSPAGNRHQIRVVDVNGPFFFGSATQVVGKVGSILDNEVIIFNCSKVPFIDYSGFFALTEMLVNIKESGIIAMIVANDALKERLTDLEINGYLPPQHIFPTLGGAFAHARKHICEDEKKKTAPQLSSL